MLGKVKFNVIRFEVPLKDGDDSLEDFPNYPFLMGPNAYEDTTHWTTTWKPEAFDTQWTEMLTIEEKGHKDSKRLAFVTASFKSTLEKRRKCDNTLTEFKLKMMYGI
jgi:hypothetical protein